MTATRLVAMVPLQLLLQALLAAPAVAAATAEPRASPPPSFEAYVAHFGLSFPEAELSTRRALYEERKAAIAMHNAQERRLWTAGVNDLTAATATEAAALLGYNKMLRSAAVAAPPRPSLRASQVFPSNLDWRDHRPSVVTAVKNQGSCGSCWAFAASEVLESRIALETGALFDLSPQQLNSCTPNPARCGGSGGCRGATAQLAFNYTARVGISTQWNYPYLSGFSGESLECLDNGTAHWSYSVRAAGIRGYVQLPQNDDRVLMEAVQSGPVAVTVAAAAWHNYERGVFDGCSKARPILNHAVVLMGYGDVQVEHFGTVHYWLIRNSWGSTWGEQGYIRLRRYPYGEPCGVDDYPLDGYACAANPPENVTACGECGVLSDSAYPVGAFLGAPEVPKDPALQPKP
mmetsp:Transcript_34167/g.103038  ORF Transcript_34167/g.103038 Transcript_34167/m.103038 type:complete len:404 (-) Transcript_34167:83-1294(-)